MAEVDRYVTCTTFVSLIPHSAFRIKGMQFEPETIYPQLTDPEIRLRLDGTSTYGINSSIPVPYWTDYFFGSDEFTQAVSFSRKKKVRAALP